MNNLMDDTNGRTSNALGQCFPVELTRTEMALVIEALLQAEMTLPLLDRRYMTLKPVTSLRSQQLSLANRLEDVLAGGGQWQDNANSHPDSWGSAQP